VRVILGGARDGRDIIHPIAADVIVLGYEGIIGEQERLLSSWATPPAEYSQ
jgi:hypothetical protein